MTLAWPYGASRAIASLLTTPAVADAARANALDRYLAARLAPRAARRDLIALAAFVARHGAHRCHGERAVDRRDPAAVVARPVLEPGPAEREATRQSGRRRPAGGDRAPWSTGRAVREAARRPLARTRPGIRPERRGAGSASSMKPRARPSASLHASWAWLPKKQSTNCSSRQVNPTGAFELLRTVPLMLEARQRSPRAHLVN